MVWAGPNSLIRSPPVTCNIYLPKTTKPLSSKMSSNRPELSRFGESTSKMLSFDNMMAGNPNDNSFTRFSESASNIRSLDNNIRTSNRNQSHAVRGLGDRPPNPASRRMEQSADLRPMPKLSRKAPNSRGIARSYTSPPVFIPREEEMEDRIIDDIALDCESKEDSTAMSEISLPPLSRSHTLGSRSVPKSYSSSPRAPPLIPLRSEPPLCRGISNSYSSSPKRAPPLTPLNRDPPLSRGVAKSYSSNPKAQPLTPLNSGVATRNNSDLAPTNSPPDRGVPKCMSSSRAPPRTPPPLSRAPALNRTLPSRKAPPPSRGISRSCTSPPVLEPRGEKIWHRTVVDVAPGCSVPLCGAEETMYAFQQECVVHTECTSCGSFLYCIDTASMVLCPTCRSISLVETDSSPRNVSERLGLGLTVEIVMEQSGK